MKVLVIFAVLIAFSEANAISKENGKPCCPKTDVDGNPLKEEVPCMTLKEFVAFREKEMSDEIYKTPGINKTTELDVQIKINAFTKAIARCAPNSAAYGRAHYILDELHTIIDKFPTPRNVQKKISEAIEVMDEVFDRIRYAQNEAGPKLPEMDRKQIDIFFKESVKKVLPAFHDNAEKATRLRKIFDEIDLMTEIDKIVDKVESCLGVDRNDHLATFLCHDQVRLQASELNDKMRDIKTLGKMTLFHPEDDINVLLNEITKNEKLLEAMLTNHKLSEHLAIDYRKYMA